MSHSPGSRLFPRRSIALALLMLFAFSGMIATAEAQRPYRPVVGEKHPDFTLPNTADGQPVSLADYRGKKALLVHFASW